MAASDGSPASVPIPNNCGANFGFAALVVQDKNVCHRVWFRSRLIAVFIAVKRLYIRDMLGEPTELPRGGK
jgi:hypothetical protein